MNKQEKCSVTQKNRIVIHKGDDEKRVYKHELQFWFDAGWEIGVSDKHGANNGNSHRGKHPKGKPITEEQKQQIADTLKKKYASGEIVVWNKGLSKDTDERVLKNVTVAEKTKMERYGSLWHNNNMSEEHKRKIGQANSIALKGKKLPPDKLIIKTTKQYLTRRNNNTFNTSSSENKLYEQLLKEHNSKTIYRNYKDDKRYPFYCDFYIKEDDLFIELNAHWTHGGMPYDPNNAKCQEQLEKWQEKAKTSKFYENAIYTWTVRDVKKQQCAKENNLNYKVIY